MNINNAVLVRSQLINAGPTSVRYEDFTMTMDDSIEGPHALKFTLYRQERTQSAEGGYISPAVNVSSFTIMNGKKMTEGVLRLSEGGLGDVEPIEAFFDCLHASYEIDLKEGRAKAVPTPPKQRKPLFSNRERRYVSPPHTDVQGRVHRRRR